MDKKYTNRSVDNLKLNKSNEYLWHHILKKVDMKKKHVAEEHNEDVTDRRATFGDFFKSLFKMPERLVSISVLSMLLIVALVFSSTLRGWFGSRIGVVHANFEMTAISEDASGVASDSAFTLTSSEDLDVGVIKDNLKVEPDVKLNISKSGKDKYEVKPVKGMEANTIYNFSIQTDHGDQSWAYQIQDTFKIVGTWPTNQSASVTANTGIEITFSHDNFDFKNIQNYFEISPKVDGRFEKHDRILAFVPKNELASGTIYTVKIKKGFGIEGSDKKLDKDFAFQFETTDIKGTTSNFSFNKAYYEMATNAPIALDYYVYNSSVETQKDLQIEIYKYKDLNQYLGELKNSLNVPQWAYAARGKYSHSIDGLQDLGSFQGMVEKPGWISYVYLPEKTLDAGYYLFQVDSDGKKAQTLVQITDLSAYLTLSTTDTIVWVNDLKTGKPVSGATVKLDNVDQNITTGEDGVAKFTTPAAWTTFEKDESPVIDTFVKITSNDGKVLVTPLDSYVAYYVDEESNYWHTFITDRPRYKPTDNVHFWGFIKPKNGVSKLDNPTMKLMYNGDVLVREIPITVNGDGSFEGDFDIKSFTPGSYSLFIYQKDKVILNNSFDVDNYVKPAYDLTMQSDKAAVFAGDNVNFSIKSEFFDGTPVPNLQVVDNGQLENATKTYVTDENGEAHGKMVAKGSDCSSYDGGYCPDENYFYYQVESKLSEQSAIQADSNIRIFNSHLNIAGKADTSKKQDGSVVANFLFKTNWIDLTKINEDKNAYYTDYLGDVAKNRKFTGTVTQVSWNKVETGEYYDFINKVTAKTYDYKKEEQKVATIEGKTDDNGQASYQMTIDPDKYYYVTLKAEDDNGKIANDTTYVYGDMSDSNYGYDYYSVKVLNGAENNEWNQSNYKFDVGETVNTAIARNSDVNLPKDTKGSFMFLRESNGIQKYEVENSPYYSFKFAKENVPNVYVEAVWFDGKTYKPAYSVDIGYKQEMKKLNIQIDSDKGNYKPGEDVNLSVYVTDKNGVPTASKVNFNVVDEAYYKAVYAGMTDPLSQIYAENNSGILYSYFTHNNPLNSRSDAGGKGGCFTGDTQISMADGKTKAIKDIQKGDKILTKADENSPRLIPAEVTGKTMKHVTEYIVINENLKVTTEHVVFANGGWNKVANLRLGDSMVDEKGNIVKITSMKRVIDPVDVYNIEIKDYHTYFANGYFVHNDKGDGGYYVRQEFKDTSLFSSVDVGPDGHGSVKFKVPDNITSWRVVATAINIDSLSAGTDTKNVKVTLPFFVDMVLNREYSVKDKPTIKFRAYGNAVKAGDDVSFKPEVDGKASDTLSGKVFKGIYFNLPGLNIGTHDVTVKADSGSMKDALKKSFEVKGSRLSQDVVKIIRNIDDKTVFDLGKQGQTEVTFMDSGAAYYYNNLLSLYYDKGKRLDQIVASKAAADILKKYFNKDFESYDEDQGNYILEAYQRHDGLTLLPYSGTDLKLSALIVTFDVNLDRYSQRGLKDYFYGILKDSKSNVDEIILSLLGLSGMKEPVLLDLREIQKVPDLTVEEKLYLGLAYAKIGSYPEAKKILQEVQAGLTTDTSNKGVHNLALGADLAAMVNDVQTAEKLWNGVKLEGFGNEDLTNLYELGYVTGSLKNAKIEPVKFKYKLNQTQENVSLETGEVKSVLASPGDTVAATVDKGSLAAVLTYKLNVEPEQFKTDSRLQITRKYFVNGKETTQLNEGDVVKIMITLNNPGSVAYPFYKVTDILPSGLTPMMGYMPMYSGGFDPDLSYPFYMNGQEISFCWFPYFKEVVGGTSKANITYYAKVVNTGEFYADPAKITSFYDQNVANISNSVMLKISQSK